MEDGYNFQRLKAEILCLSGADDWETARKEWSLVDVFEAEAPETCLCGHFPIREVCVIENRLTGNRTDVGNQCVRRFLGYRSDLIFSAIKKIRKDFSKSLNTDAIAFFREKGVLNEWEYQFSQDTLRKRVLSDRQIKARVKINEKVINAISRRGFRGPEEMARSRLV